MVSISYWRAVASSPSRCQHSEKQIVNSFLFSVNVCLFSFNCVLVCLFSFFQLGVCCNASCPSSCQHSPEANQTKSHSGHLCHQCSDPVWMEMIFRSNFFLVLFVIISSFKRFLSVIWFQMFVDKWNFHICETSFIQIWYFVNVKKWTLPPMNCSPSCATFSYSGFALDPLDPRTAAW